MRFFLPLLHFIFRLGLFGPLAMGVLDSSFLVLPFGNDLLVVRLVSGDPHKTAWYVFMAACGSTLGAFFLALVSRKLGEEGISKLAGKRQYDKLRRRIGKRAGIAVAVGGIAPPPFPFTTVIAAVAALRYSIGRILCINFVVRAVRFTLLSLLAIRYGKDVIQVMRTQTFEWAMVAFIALCVVASAISIAHWVRRQG
jgi:membrane protein YqaA with SNARE-associated domain